MTNDRGGRGRGRTRTFGKRKYAKPPQEGGAPTGERGGRQGEDRGGQQSSGEQSGGQKTVSQQGGQQSGEQGGQQQGGQRTSGQRAGAQQGRGQGDSGPGRRGRPTKRTAGRPAKQGGGNYGRPQRRQQSGGQGPRNRQQPRGGGIRAQTKGGKFGENWWARRWIEVLEGFEMGSRLNRGREYAKKGLVLSVQIDQGRVQARVQGSRPRPYEIDIRMVPIPEPDWERVAARLGEQAVFSAQLLAGEMPGDIEELFEDEGLSLYPAAEGDLKSQCSCPDTANPCKHAAAVYLLLGEEFDRDPFLLFALRGMRRDLLLAMIEKQLPQHATNGDNESGEPRANGAAEEIQEEPKQPLALDPDVYWKGSVRLPEEVMGDVTPPSSSCALPRRLGPFPFWQGQKPILDALEPIYRKASQHAVVFLLGEPQ